MQTVDIGGRKVGRGQPCFVIAEAGVNHNGDVELAKRLVDVAADAGADAVKFQSFRADLVASPDAKKARYQANDTTAGESQLDMLRRLELTERDHAALIARCIDRGIMFLSTPFDEPSVDLLDSLEVPAFKIGSGELSNAPFLAYIAAKGRPIILSTGMATFDEVGTAISWLDGAPGLVLLHCISEYPADPADANLLAMGAMHEQFGVPVGFSDHTLGVHAALAATALGACVIEKHFTLDVTMAGPDHGASVDPAGLRSLVAGIRIVEVALGDGVKRPTDGEMEIAEVARRSLVAADDIVAGTVLTAGMIAVRRPGTGLPPSMRAAVLGRRVVCDVSAGSVLTQDMLS